MNMTGKERKSVAERATRESWEHMLNKHLYNAIHLANTTKKPASIGRESLLKSI
jgi:hypothetical protein